MKNVVLFGASGNIGKQCLEILKENKEQFNLKAISIGKNDSEIEFFLLSFPSIEKVYSTNNLGSLKSKYPKVEFFNENILDIFSEKDEIVINALIGFFGLKITLESIKRNHILLNANKESFVVGGELINEMIEKSKTKIYPLDSEHCAIFQCLENNNKAKEIFLTASGGSFSNLTIEETKNISFDDALKHPNWVMGKKITIDSSTMFNKAFEILEAYHLFKVPKITTLLHPQSIIHSMVGFEDGSIKAQLSVPDMKQVINYFLNYPKRVTFKYQKDLDFNDLINLTLKKIDQERFKPIKMALNCLQLNNSKAIAMNAANEVCVEYFINKKIEFFEITEIVEDIFTNCEDIKLATYEEILDYDSTIRKITLKRIGEIKKWVK